MQKRNSPESHMFIFYHHKSGSVALGSLSDGSDCRDLLHSKILDEANKKAKKERIVFLKALHLVIRTYGFIPKVL